MLSYHPSWIGAKGEMRLPSKTSKLLAMQQAAKTELRARLDEIFRRYRGLAFAARNDQLFTEHWTPEGAASGYVFDGFEVRGDDIVLHGLENACGFVYRISIAFPVALIDHPAAIEAHFQHQFAKAREGVAVSATAQADLRNPKAN